MSSMGGKDREGVNRVGVRESCGGSWAGERRGLGGTGRSEVPKGEAACTQGWH